MIWVTWRQQRLEMLIASAVLALVALFLLVTGLDMASTYRQTGVAGCLGSQDQACAPILDAFRHQFVPIINIVGWFEFLPLLFGVLLAAPLALELEQGTYRLAWTQSITRSRWITRKLAVVMCAAILIALTLTALVTWWRIPLDQLGSRFDPIGFDFEGTVPLAYTICAVALGLAVGALVRRAIPAVAIATVGFFALRVVIELWARPHYLPPLVRAMATGRLHRSDWLLGESYSDRFGHQLDLSALVQLCGSPIPGGMHINPTCLRRHGIIGVVTYQPADRFWLFQGIESALFLGLAAGLLALTVWWVRSRIA